MFGLSTELITKGKLVTVKRFESPDAVNADECVNLFTVVNLPLVINPVNKPNSSLRFL